MDLRFRKSIKIAPGVKLNLNKKSTSISFGGKHGGVMVNSRVFPKFCVKSRQL